MNKSAESFRGASGLLQELSFIEQNHSTELIPVFLTLIQEMNYGVTITDSAKRAVWVNKAFSAITGYTLQDVWGKNISEVLCGPLTDPKTSSVVKNQVNKGLPFYTELIFYKKTGEPFLMHVQGGAFKDEQGRVVGYFALQHDRTTEHEKEQKIISSEKKYRVMFQASPFPKIIVDTDTLFILEVNKAARKLYGYTEAEFMRLPVSELLGDSALHCREWMNRLKETGKIAGEMEHFTKRKRRLLVDITSVLFDYNHKTAALCIVKDITNSRKLEDRLTKIRIKYEQKVMNAKLQAQEAERNEIGKELHDNINQLLSAVKLYQEMALENEALRLDMIRKGQGILIEAMQEIRNLSHALVGANFTEKGLMSSIQDLIIRLQAVNRFTVDFNYEGIDEQLPHQLKLSIFRIVQEQLNNIVKHAYARHISISIRCEEDAIRLRVADDGVGFAPVQRNKGIGFSNIASRVRLCKGELFIESNEGKGCTVEASFPLKRKRSVTA